MDLDPLARTLMCVTADETVFLLPVDYLLFRSQPFSFYFFLLLLFASSLLPVFKSSFLLLILSSFLLSCSSLVVTLYLSTAGSKLVRVVLARCIRF